MIRSLLISFGGVFALSFSGAAHAGNTQLLSDLVGKELADLSADYDQVELGTVYTWSPIKADTDSLRHFEKVVYTAKVGNAEFVAFQSYLDEEDGGNTYGWLTSADGKVIARIADSGIEAVVAQQVVRTDRNLEIHYVVSSEVNFVSKLSMSFDDTAVPLDSIFDPFGRNEPKSICYVGDINQVCSLLSSMSKFSQEQYSSGGHGLAQLKGCRILGRHKPVEARIELSDDYDAGIVKIVSTIEACL